MKKDKVVVYRYKKDTSHKKLKIGFLFLWFGWPVVMALGGAGGQAQGGVPGWVGSLIWLAVFSGIFYLWFRFLRPHWKNVGYYQGVWDTFLERNNFVKSHVDKDRHGRSYIQMDYVPYIQYKEDIECFYVSFRKDGSLISQSFDNDMGVRLGNLLNYQLLEMNEDNSFIRFYYAKQKEERLRVSHNIGDLVSPDGYAIRMTSKLDWDISKAPHLLLVGGTGTGKSMLLFYLLSVFFAGGATVKVCDPKASDLSQTGFVFGSENIATSPAQIAGVLREAEEEMDKRYAYMNSHNDGVGLGKDFTAFGLHPYIVCIDELMALVAGSTEKKLVDEIKKRVLTLTVKGRAAGVFIWCALQRADTSFIDGAVRDNLGVRIGLGNLSSDGNSMVFGSEYRDLSLTSTAKGAGFIYVDGQTASPRPFEAPYVDDVVSMLKDAANVRKARMGASDSVEGHSPSAV